MAESIFLNIDNPDKVFENITFTDFIFEKNIETTGDILFNKCIFKNTFAIENLNAREVGFFNCKFEKGCYLTESNFFIVGFTNCDFSDEFNLTANKCISSFVLRNIKANKLTINGEYQTFQIVSSNLEELILQDINTNHSYKESKIEFLVENNIKEVRISGHSTQSSINFIGSTYKNIFFEGSFAGKIHFKKDSKIENLYLESSTFKKRIDFEEGEFKYVSFYRSNFQNLVFINDFNDIRMNSRNLSIEHLTIHSCIFEMDIHVQLEKIKHLSLSNNNFKQLFDFNNFTDEIKSPSQTMIYITGTNQGNIIIERAYVDITLTNINFGNIFFKDLNITHLHIYDFQNEGNITFSNIKSGEYFSIKDSLTGKLNFVNFNINIFKEIVFANCNLHGINFNTYPNKILSYSTDSRIGYGISQKSKNNSNLKSIYNQLKHISRSKGDIDISNKFQSLEYQQLLLSKRPDTDSIVLFLNWLSNNNGRSWFRGVIFTLSVAFIFYLMYLNAIEINFNSPESYKEYISFISSFPKLELDKYACENNYWNTKLIVWLSRIFIGYGIYQTISAFRKYGKG